MSKKYILPLMLFALLSGCVSNTSVIDLKTKEDMLIKSKNYVGLIDLYRGWLKTEDTVDKRYKLATYYYLMNDSEASLFYLEPILSGKMGSNIPDEIMLLEAKNYIEQSQFSLAVEKMDLLIKRRPKNAEAYNTKGIALALDGELTRSRVSLEQARGLFLDEMTALNNLAMLNIFEGHYQKAINLLMPQYLRNQKNPKLVHNLVFALVKVGNTKYAKEIIEKEGLAKDANELIASLKKIKDLNPNNKALSKK